MSENATTAAPAANEAVEFNRTRTTIAADLNLLALEIHRLNRRWWLDLQTGQPTERNVGEMLMLMVTELGEACEGHRKGLMDTHLKHRPMMEVEMADLLIRLLDFCAGMNLDLGGAFVEKLEYNVLRSDHSREARLAAGGKKY